jgi:uncharacterized 2Fe-2S/4Fe-4S cluster protein (DUF4445 family)
MKSGSKSRRFLIDLEPIGRRAEVEDGESILEAAWGAGVELVSICGGVGICDSCLVRVVEGEVTPITPSERDALSEEQIEAGFRMACQAVPLSDVKIDIPAQSLTTPQRLQIEGREMEANIEPPVRAVDLQIQPPGLEDLRSDSRRVIDAFSALGLQVQLGFHLLRSLPDQLRANEWALRFALRGSEVIAALPPGTRLLGLAADIGTTKLAAYLVDLESGMTLAKAGAMNPQIPYGEDVVSRIAYANRAGEEGVANLRGLVIQALNELVETLCEEAGVGAEGIIEAVAVGNTAMHHFFAGLPVKQLGEAPYVPAVGQAMEVPVSQLGLKLSPGSYLYLPPNIAGYVGADHVAMVLATGCWDTDRTVMAVDIGTNTEITLAANGRLISCSCASGPAFEGAHIRDGMRAAPGAIERVRFQEGEVQIQTIGGRLPVGLCGSGILDAVAQMLKNDLLDHRGALKVEAERVRKRDGNIECLLCPAEETGHQRDIVITRSDVNEVQLAKGAIRSGIDILLQEAGLEAGAIESFIVAGAFGTYVDPKSAIAVGMFPDLPLDRFHQVGNAAGEGAKHLLISKTLREVADQIMERVEYVELTTHPDFMDTYMRCLYF